MRLGIVRPYTGNSGNKLGYYNVQEIGLAKMLIEKGDIEIFIFMYRDKKEYPNLETVQFHPKITIVFLPVLSIGTQGLTNPTFLKKYKIDLVQINSDLQINTLIMVSWCKINNLPVYTLFGVFKPYSSNIATRLIFGIYSKLFRIMLKDVVNIAKNKDVYKILQKNKIRNVKLIPIGLDVTNFLKTNNKMILRSKYKLSVERKILLFIGRFEENKKPMYLPDIMKKL